MPQLVTLKVTLDDLQIVATPESSATAPAEQVLTPSDLKLIKLVSGSSDALNRLRFKEWEGAKASLLAIRIIASSGCLSRLSVLEIGCRNMLSMDAFFIILSSTPLLTDLSIGDGERETLYDPQAQDWEPYDQENADGWNDDQDGFPDAAQLYPVPACRLRVLMVSDEWCFTDPFLAYTHLLTNSLDSLEGVMIFWISSLNVGRSICAALRRCTRVQNVAFLGNSFSIDRTLRACSLRVTRLDIMVLPPPDVLSRACPALKELEILSGMPLDHFGATNADFLVALVSAIQSLRSITVHVQEATAQNVPGDASIASLYDACRRRRVHLQIRII